MKSPYVRSSLVVSRRLMLIAALFCLPSLASAQSGTTKEKPKSGSSAKAQAFSPGIKVGAKVPAISLKDQNGETVSLQSMLQTGVLQAAVGSTAKRVGEIQRR